MNRINKLSLRLLGGAATVMASHLSDVLHDQECASDLMAAGFSQEKLNSLITGMAALEDSLIKILED